MRRHLVATLIASLFSDLALAANPVRPETPPRRWDTSSPVVWNPDGGGLALIQDPIGRVAAGFAAWDSVPTAVINFAQGGQIVDAGGTPVDVTEANYAEIIHLENGQNPIIFDNDGAIHELTGFFFALGFVADFHTEGSEITKSIIVLNGRFWDGDDTGGVEVDPDWVDGVITHEIGHFIGLGHSSVNLGSYLTGTGVAGCAAPGSESVETMSPFIGAGRESLHFDDRVGVSLLYPSQLFARQPKVSGRLYNRDGITPYNGGSVIIRPNTSDCQQLYDAAQGTQAGSNPGETGGDGTYRFDGLSQNTGYTVRATSILSGGFARPRKLAGPDDSYNEPGEDVAFPPDDPAEQTVVTTGGLLSHRTGIDILLNNPTGPGTTHSTGFGALGVRRVDESLLPTVELRVDNPNTLTSFYVAPQLAWINRFDLDPGSLAIRVDQLLFPLDSDDRAVRLLVYADPAATGDPRNATLVHTQDVVLTPLLGTHVADLEPPVVIEGGEFYLGALDLEAGPVEHPRDPTPGSGRSFMATASSDPEDFVPLSDTVVGDGIWRIMARGTVLYPEGSVHLSWSGACGDLAYDFDYAVYEGSLGSLGGTLDHAPIACHTGTSQHFVLPGPPDRFWLVSPLLDGVEGTLGEGTGGSSRQPLMTCETVDPDDCP